jgi:hypothetical protein
VNIAAYVLFFIAGVAFGYAAPGRWKWVPLLFPVVLGIGALVNDGPDAAIFMRLVVALLITGGGVVVGTLIDSRTREGADHPRYA